jgi:hypothetical protein
VRTEAEGSARFRGTVEEGMSDEGQR